MSKKTSKYEKETIEIMNNICKLIDNWFILAKKIKKPSIELQNHFTEFENKLHNTFLPKKKKKEKTILNRTFAKVLNPPSPKVTQSRNTRQRSQTVSVVLPTVQKKAKRRSSDKKRKKTSSPKDKEVKSNENNTNNNKKSMVRVTSESGIDFTDFGELLLENETNTNVTGSADDANNYIADELGFDISGIVDIPNEEMYKNTNSEVTTNDSLNFDLSGLNFEIPDYKNTDNNDVNQSKKEDILNSLGFDVSGIEMNTNIDYNNIDSTKEISTKDPFENIDLKGINFDTTYLNNNNNNNDENTKQPNNDLNFNLEGLDDTNYNLNFDVSDIDSNIMNIDNTIIKKEEEKTKENTNNQLSYEDFMAALTNNTNNTTTIPISPRGNKLIRGLGMREDMNRKGMAKIKKKSVTTGLKKKGIYQMEDTNYIGFPFNENNDIALLAVFDGHSGKNAATEAKKIFPELLQDYLQNNKLTIDCKKLFKELFIQTDNKLLEYETEGTTATSVLIWKVGEDRYLQSANVGDSTAFLCRNKKAIALGIDHKVNNPSEIKRMKDAGMVLNKNQTRINGLALCRTLGDHFIKEHFAGVIADPYVSPSYKLEDTDSHLILASDGLWDVINGQEAYDMIKNLSSPQDMSSKLINHALNSGKCSDNITVIVTLL